MKTAAGRDHGGGKIDLKALVVKQIFHHQHSGMNVKVGHPACEFEHVSRLGQDRNLAGNSPTVAFGLKRGGNEGPLPER
jgi:hypothetical protein